MDKPDNVSLVKEECQCGDGVMFYFHGVKGGNYAIVSDDNLQINAHFIGTRPEGLTRNYTWCKLLQSCLTLTVLSLLPRGSHIGMIMLMHSLPIGAKENRIQNYQLPDDDAFAHLETVQVSKFNPPC
ncbi:hypothetical protein Patl1_30716 [Pistacia atlantica]|uniref:Uncharacterized protein n=1 Tax=Pistacia atlantica TaxID=434234 RepID=A0ACC1AC16_9ROSI|nr:hypothetical protein Patl1_30716 [Pistacia atlantica]